MKRMILLGIVPLLLVAGCATSNPETLAAQRASCERMEQDMGLGTTHDHQAMKGAGLNPMNLTHERCQQLLSEER